MVRFRVKWVLVGLIAGVWGQELQGQPDLKVNRRLLKTSMVVERDRFSQSDCDYVEGCLRSAGRKKLLRLDVGMVNIGRNDLVIGTPESRPGLFEWSPCHEHYHMKTMVRYRLLNLNYSQVLTGRKQAFCLRDNYPFTSWAGASKGFDCTFQGITAGWQDVYDKSLDCQYLDITGVPRGSYLLEVEINPLRVFREVSYANNKVVVQVSVP